MTVANAKPDLLITGPLGTTTVNAASSLWSAYTGVEAKITAAIAYAVSIGAKAVYVPDCFLPYTASLVTFNSAVRMTREGGRSGNIIDVKAYGASGDGVTDDTPAFTAAFAAASAQAQFFGTTNVGTPLVVVPEVVSTSGQTKAYLITTPLALPPGLRMEGEGTFAPQLIHSAPGNSSTMFTFFGATEGAPANILLKNLALFESGSTLTCIALRVRNFDWIRLDHVQISNFRVGVWMDWGQDVELRNCEITGCTRATQWGGNIAQAESPAPPAGVRGGGGGAAFCDHIAITTCLFSGNQLDIGDMGSTKADGNMFITNNTFFESPGSPVSGKFRFVSVANRQGLTFIGNTIESPNTTRTGLFLGRFDVDGNLQGTCYGAAILGNQFFNNNSTSSFGIDITEGSGVYIAGNVFKVASGGTSFGIVLRSNTYSTAVGNNAWITTSGITETDATAPLISIVAQPGSGHAITQAGPTVNVSRLVGGYSTPGETVLVSGVDAATANTFSVTLTAARVVGAPLNPVAGQRIVFTLIQGGAGGFAATWNAVFKGLTWSDAGNAVNTRSTVAFSYDGTNWNQDGAQTPYHL